VKIRAATVERCGEKSYLPLRTKNITHAKYSSSGFCWRALRCFGEDLFLILLPVVVSYLFKSSLG
jgi:hypothetical protein